MLAVISCLIGVLSILVIAELLWRSEVLRGEYQRKFVHVTAGTFFASWPWLLPWRTIQIMGLAMIVVLTANRFDTILHFSANLRKHSLGGLCLALSVSGCALLTTNKIFFAVAILQTSLADGFAAVFGTRFGMGWQYKAFGQLKTVIGTMAFWVTSLFIIGIGLLFAYSQITPQAYAILLLALPPFLAAVENITPLGLDNLTVPIAALLVIEALSI